MNQKGISFLKTLKIAFILAVVASGCGQQNRQDKITIQDLVDEMPYVDEFEPVGQVIGEIDYKIKAVDSADFEVFEDGLIPWISLENPEDELKYLFDSNEMVLDKKKVTLVIDYPVKKPVQFVIESDSELGFTRKQLILKISSTYKKMYFDEEESATIKTLPMEERSFINRNTTNGKYGIWGHDLSDLDLSSIEVRQEASGKTLLYLNVES